MSGYRSGQNVQLLKSRNGQALVTVEWVTLARLQKSVWFNKNSLLTSSTAINQYINKISSMFTSTCNVLIDLSAKGAFAKIKNFVKMNSFHYIAYFYVFMVPGKRLGWFIDPI